MDEETRKRIERRAEEVYNEDPAVRLERLRRAHAEIIARQEILAEEQQKQAANRD